MKLARSSVASLIVSFALISGWVAVTSYLLKQSIFSPGRFATAAQTVIQSPAVRSDMAHAISQTIAGSMELALPKNTAEIDTALQGALLAPAVQAEVVGALSQAQQRLMGQKVSSITIGGYALQSAIQENLLSVDPGLASSVAGTPLSVTIPGAKLPNLGWLYRNIDAIERDSLFLAIGLAAIALLLAPRRSKILYEIGGWLIVMSAVEALIFYVIPVYFLPLSHTSWAPVISVVLKAIGGPAVSTYVALLASGIIVIVGTTVFKRDA